MDAIQERLVVLAYSEDSKEVAEEFYNLISENYSRAEYDLEALDVYLMENSSLCELRQNRIESLKILQLYWCYTEFCKRVLNTHIPFSPTIYRENGIYYIHTRGFIFDIFYRRYFHPAIFYYLQGHHDDPEYMILVDDGTAISFKVASMFLHDEEWRNHIEETPVYNTLTNIYDIQY